MRPESILLATGAISIGAGYRREGTWPKYGASAVVGVLGLVLLASMTEGTRVAPIVKGLSWLMLLAALYSAVPAFRAKPTTPAKKGK